MQLRMWIKSKHPYFVTRGHSYRSSFLNIRFSFFLTHHMFYALKRHISLSRIFSAPIKQCLGCKIRKYSFQLGTLIWSPDSASNRGYLIPYASDHYNGRHLTSCPLGKLSCYLSSHNYFPNQLFRKTYCYQIRNDMGPKCFQRL